MHEAAPSVEYCPVLHGRHTASEVALVAPQDVPAGHLVHELAPAAEKVPGGQSLQILDGFEYVPAGHVVHSTTAPE